MNSKILIFSLLAVALLSACGQRKAPESAAAGKTHPAWSLDATIYELNTRQFTPEGTFAAAQTHLERLKTLGVEILWVMPIQPIGVKERKGDLGSYYAIRDYTAVNPEFGTLDDFKAFVAAAHALEMKVILDWVANHTSPDAVWVGNEGWHVRDSLGNTVGPYDWTDVAELNYDNREMRAAMVEAMKFWLTEAGIDGFRCDVAGEVPTDFWNEATPQLEAVKPDIFMLAEAELPELEESAFDMYYGWDLHARLNGLAAGTQNADSLRDYFVRHDARFPLGFPMLFTSNHDENSWNGTEFERMGTAAPTLAALTFALPGMPLIYNGQEIGLNRRLEFFTKDSIDWTSPNDYTLLYQSLNTLRKSNPALWSDGAGGAMLQLENSAPARVLSLLREKGNNRVIALFNLGDQSVEVTVGDPRFQGTFKTFNPRMEPGQEAALDPTQTFMLAPWEYRIWFK
jgi:glycosidase